MNITIFLNGKHNGERLNLLIQNGYMTGMGYLPDEDEETATLIDIPNYEIHPTGPFGLGLLANFTITDPSTKKNHPHRHQWHCHNK